MFKRLGYFLIIGLLLLCTTGYAAINTALALGAAYGLSQVFN